MPMWVCKHPYFPVACEKLYLAAGPLPDDVGNKLLRVKEIMREAGKAVLRRTVDRGAKTVEERIHWNIVLLRSINKGSMRRVRMALTAYPKLLEFVTIAQADGQIS
eukprot:2488216-Karenia_brevis.AAC.1